ncbi:2-amino-4-hydroxy-6-hydroxymethyldihydropteridine diphosphokinase [Nocardiopsis sp. FIRDI 009]|uniref:2-amino-4-hydroxy-6- hydroxymethyldihydropteridine diphosphokinase n=1 Tax=Nocardiopsis sp. FIRDI 009 TaxID=714197 RepID=UPI000E261951|nr:2-amino-4-hydroxy-6-hydroxymethyldihydropteridine diphosphokinase [Nocardiopsis sp. FIRDI 009]
MTVPNPISAVVGIGSNIRPERHVPAVYALLEQRFHVTASSPVYRSPAVGMPPGTGDFLNLAVELEWSGSLFELKGALESVEDLMGRRRSDTSAWVSRTVDLDILTAGDLSGSVGAFEVPHPDIEVFAHTAVPLTDLAGERIHPRLGVSYGEIAAGLDTSALVRIGALTEDGNG